MEILCWHRIPPGVWQRNSGVCLSLGGRSGDGAAKSAQRSKSTKQTQGRGWGIGAMPSEIVSR